LDICKSKKPFENIDYSKVANRLQPEVERGMTWLKNALECPTKQNEDTIRTLRVEKERLVNGMALRIKRLEKQNADLRAELANFKSPKQ
jgi:hypothetical protein